MKTNRTDGLGLLLHDAARLMRRRFEKRGRDLGLSSAQWRLLVRLMRERRATQARLAELMEVEPISVSRLVDRMVEADWVERQKDPDDRRKHIVVPTAKALRAFDAIRDMAGEVYDEALTGFSAEERQQIVALLGRVVTNLATCEDPADSCLSEQEA